MDQATLYQTQISFTEWFEQIQHKQTEEMRQEDNEKRERLKVLQQYLQLPYDKPVQFMATDLAKQTLSFKSFLQERGSELCALRLIPLQDNLPKLRLRGATVRKVMDWFAQQAIDPTRYRAEFVPHAEQTLWSTIFVVNAHGVFGEIIRGNHYQLTQGFYEQKLVVFSYDFSAWTTHPENEEALTHLKGILKRLKVADYHSREDLQQELQATFANQYLCGYFETVFSLEQGLWFCDYNRILGKMHEHFQPVKGVGDLSGVVAHPGKVQGRVRIVLQPEKAVITDGDILVCDMTTPAYVLLMKKAGAIVTNKGGLLTHAAIVARELGKPCIVGVEKATRELKDGEMVEVDAEKGIVKRLT